MIVYNITVKVDREIEKEWIEWQKREHIPEIMATGLFTEYQFFRLLEQDETGENTFVIQYKTSSHDNYSRYIEIYAPDLRKKAIAKWQEKFIAFRTVMESVN